MKSLSKKHREIVRLLSQGASDLQVSRQFGLQPGQLDQILAMVTKRASELEAEENEGAMVERALRRRAENSVASYEARFDALMEASTEAVLVVNALTGIIGQVNESAARLFGTTREGLIGRSVEDLVPVKYRAIHPAFRIGFLSSVRKREMGYHPPIFALRTDGSEIEVAVALTTATTNEDVMVICTEFERWKALEAVDAEFSQRN